MKGDRAVETGADKLEDLSGKAAAKGGLASKLADELAEDAAFLRKLKPSLMVKRAQGRLPKDAEPDAGTPTAPSGPQHAPPKRGGAGPNPFAVAGAAFGVGTLIAKVIDWRSHAHPRR
ncbi:MAG: hypothetical protein QOJ43_1508 [Gaiellaceae bacterium]|jgi:hypothetical protein|nr:hypothetical protein [Gaiellaceae bacterium]